jgi:hypothetical protein
MSTKQYSGPICWDPLGRTSSEFFEISEIALSCARYRRDADGNSDYKTSQTDALLADRGRIDSSHRMIDDTLK